MQIKHFQGGYDKNVSYLIWCETTKIASIIDASVSINNIINCINKNKLQLDKVFITHTHFDHIRYLGDITYNFPSIKIYGFCIPEQDLGNNFVKLSNHQIIQIGTEMITAIHTPGHYPDSMCYWHRLENYLFTGDTIFVGRTGRTVGRKSNIKDLYNSVYNKILKLPCDTIIFPGHNYGHKLNITLKENINYSSFFQCTTEQEFVKVMMKYENNRLKK